ncbi:MAG: hypothetical protein B6U85_05460 [Desulfurococcales archaeon ex4484_42]|nr:MAG: hypothetical protein B6U85_05460 [Desulfurococcales archaeon ex4484_42]
MSFNFTALTLFSSLSSHISLTYGLSIESLKWAASAFTIGIFFAFLIGHSKYFEYEPKLGVLVAGLAVSIPQFLIPFIGNFIAITALRIVQGLAMAAIPVFSYQAGTVFPRHRTLAIGIIVSGIFIGGFLGSTLGPELTLHIGWRFTFIVFGLVTLILTLSYVALIPDKYLPPKRVAKEEVMEFSVWREKFTVIWGFTFFPGLWIVFTLAPLIHFISESMYEVSGILSSTILESSYIVWSYIPGVALALLKHSRLNARSLFRSVALTQAILYVLSMIGALAILLIHNPTTFLALLAILAAVQGTGPTFWSVQTIAYPKHIAHKAGYALGVISNSAALVGPIATLLISSLGPTNIWLLIIALNIAGVVITLIGMRTRLPVEKFSSRTFSTSS